MAITTIATVKSTDTFETQRTQLNSGLTKLNGIDLDKEVIRLEDSATDPADSTIPAGSFALYMQPDGDIFVKINVCGTIKTSRLVDYAAL